MVAPALKIYGLSELRRAFTRAGKIDERNELRAGLRAAGEVVARDAQGRIQSRTGRSRQGLRVVSGGNRTYIAEGGARYPHLAWLDFGGRTPISGNPRSVGPWAGSGKGPPGGRLIYPALDAKHDEVVRLVEHAVGEALEDLGL